MPYYGKPIHDDNDFIQHNTFTEEYMSMQDTGIRITPKHKKIENYNCVSEYLNIFGNMKFQFI